MDLEPMEPAKERRQRPGYYERHQYRQPPSWKDWAFVAVGMVLVVWMYVYFGASPM